MAHRFIYFVLIIALFSCNKRSLEDPFEVAKNYCNCVDEEMKKNKDSLINIYDCEKKIFPNSRLMQIEMFSDANPVSANREYSFATLDSANKFSSKVISIIDTMCFLKFDQKRVKKIPHIAM